MSEMTLTDEISFAMRHLDAALKRLTAAEASAASDSQLAELQAIYATAGKTHADLVATRKAVTGELRRRSRRRLLCSLQGVMFPAA